MLFGDQLSSLMNRRSVSNYKLHKDLGFSKSSIANWRENKSQPNSEAVRALSEYFGVSADYLMGLSEDPVPPSASGDDIKLNELEFALYGEVKDLTDEEKQELLRMAQRMNELRKLKGGKD